MKNWISSSLSRLFIVVVLSAFASELFAAAGDLDISFSLDVGLTVDADYKNSVNAIAIQADGKIVVGGYPVTVDGTRTGMARLNADGSLDGSFNPGSGVNGSVTAIVLQPDGKILVGGGFSAVNGTTKKYLARLNADGSLDSGFSPVFIANSCCGASVNAIAIQADGKILVGGVFHYSDVDNILRLNTDGSRDNTFDVDYIYGGQGIVETISIQTDGKIIVGGEFSNGVTNYISRLNSDGTQDNSFNIGSGTNGSVLTSVLQPDGKILIGGYFNEINGVQKNNIARLNIDGTLDNSFSDPIIDVASVSAIAILPDGKLVIGRGFDSGAQITPVKSVVRLNQNGSLDSSFNSALNDSVVAEDAVHINAIAVQVDGNVIVSGWYNNEFGWGSHLAQLIAISDADGDGIGDMIDTDDDNDHMLDVNDPCPFVAYLDCHFGNNGIAITSIGATDFAGGIIQQSDGKIVQAGKTYNNLTGTSYAAVRYLENGLLDSNFGSNGIITTSFDNPSDDRAVSVVQQLDEKLVLAGMTSRQGDSCQHISASRYNTNGTLDSTFDTDGKIVINSELCGQGRSVIQQKNGKIVIAGNIQSLSSGEVFFVGRYNLDGTLDTSFNGSGMLSTAVGLYGDNAQSVIQQSDGKLVVSGGTVMASEQQYAVVRYLTDGTLDPSFGTNGIVTTPFNTSNLGALSVIQQRDGKLIIAGIAYEVGTGVSAAVFIRYLQNGNLDLSFGDNGISLIKIPGYSIGIYSVIQEADGKLVASGSTGDGTGRKLILIRLNLAGDLDANFGNGGTIMTSVGAGDGNDWKIVQQIDGKLLAGGTVWNGTFKFAALRFITDPDTDGDGIYDNGDRFPNNPTEWVDNDNDGIGNNADADDDNDLMPDAWEIQYGFNPLVNDASGDLDGDGFTNLQEYTNGTDPTVSNNVSVSVKNDYNNDAIAGWIWKGQSNGVETQTQIWQLSFPLYSANFATPARTFPPVFADQANWEIVTSGDFNKDGDADIVWRHKTTAAWKIWQIQDGLRAAQTNWTDAFDPSHEWQVVGAGDTDKDGDDDIILSNTSTGEVMLWQMQNYAVAATHNVGTKAGYTLNRVGDFNKDGDVDLLFRQNGGDALITWEIENNAFVTERALANTGTGYSPVCAADFDNDGDDDIMLVNSTSQQEKWFVMENYTRTQQFGGINDGFVLLGCGDYDGDGDADTLWQRSADGMNRIVLQQNWGATKQTVYTNPFGGANGFVYRGNSN